MHKHVKLQKWYIFLLALQDLAIKRCHTEIKPSMLPSRKLISEIKKSFLDKTNFNETTSVLKTFQVVGKIIPEYKHSWKFSVKSSWGSALTQD